MRFLIDACLPRDFSPLLVTYGNISIDVRDVGMRRAEDTESNLSWSLSDWVINKKHSNL